METLLYVSHCRVWEIKSLFFADNKKQHQAKLSILGSLYKYIDHKLVCEFFWVLNDGVSIWFETQSISQSIVEKKNHWS